MENLIAELSKKLDTVISQNESLADSLEEALEKIEALQESVSNLSLPGSDYEIERYE